MTRVQKLGVTDDRYSAMRRNVIFMNISLLKNNVLAFGLLHGGPSIYMQIESCVMIYVIFISIHDVMPDMLGTGTDKTPCLVSLKILYKRT